MLAQALELWTPIVKRGKWYFRSSTGRFLSANTAKQELEARIEDGLGNTFNEFNVGPLPWNYERKYEVYALVK